MSEFENSDSVTQPESERASVASPGSPVVEKLVHSAKCSHCGKFFRVDYYVGDESVDVVHSGCGTAQTVLISDIPAMEAELDASLPARSQAILSMLKPR